MRINRRSYWHNWHSAGLPMEVLRDLLKNSTWKKHPAPFAKTRRGRQRRAEKLFVMQMKGTLA